MQFVLLFWNWSCRTTTSYFLSMRNCLSHHEIFLTYNSHSILSLPPYIDDMHSLIWGLFKQINERENSSWTIFSTKLLLNTQSLTYLDYMSLISDIGKKIIVFNIFAWFHISLTFCKSNFLPLGYKIIFLFHISIYMTCMPWNTF